MKFPGYTRAQPFHAGRNHQLYRAWDEKGKRSVVLKVANQGGAGPALLEREYRLLKQLRSRGIIVAHDLIDLDDVCVLVLEEMGGQTLSGLSLSRGEQLQDFLELAMGICVALSYVHNMGIIHRHIKPAHILVHPRSGEVRLIDFSIASHLVSERPKLLDPEQNESSPVYLAPEQTGLFERSVDARADIYSLGAVLYELACGEPPFRTNSLIGLAIRITKDPRPLHETNPMIPRPVSFIVGHMLAREASDRYSTVNDVIFDLANCLASLRSHQPIETLALSQQANSKFLISEKLYGREKELAVLRDCFTNVRLGQTELVMLEGEAGIGKTTLVREQRHMLLAAGGFYVEGQFEQFQGDQPYSAISQSFSAALGQLERRRGYRWQELRKQVAHAIGNDGPIVSQILALGNPSAGSEEAYEQLSPEVTRSRLNHALLRIITVLAGEKHPLVFFLDNLQWADDASLELLSELLSHREICHFLLIGAHREISSTHPVQKMLAMIKRNRVAVTLLKPERLSLGHLKLMLVDTLKSGFEEVTSLAELLALHADGNPFLTRELLIYLWERRVLFFDGLAWNWSAAETAVIPSDLASLMASRLRALPSETRDFLSLASCFRGELNLEIMSFLLKQSVRQTARDLLPVLQKHILVPTSPAYRLSICRRAQRGAGLDAGFFFCHENYRKAAYHLLIPEEKRALHLAIGRALYDSWHKQEERLVELVGFFNAGHNLIHTPSERQRVAQLNLAAGRKNLQAVAFTAADHHFEAGLNLLGKKPWIYGHDLVFPLMLHAAETSLMFGRIDRSQALYRSLTRAAKTDLQRVHIIDSRLKKYRGVVPKQAVKLGLRALRLLGLKVSGVPSEALIKKELTLTRNKLGANSLQTLGTLPVVSDPDLLTLFRLLGKLPISATFQGKNKLAILLSAKSIQLTLIHGLSPEAAYFFSAFGTNIARQFGDLANATRLNDYALKLIDQRAYSTSRGQVLLESAMGVWSLTHHWGELTHLLKQAAESAMQNGDLLSSAHACAHLTHWDPSSDLSSNSLEDKYYQTLLESRFSAELSLRTFSQFNLCLRGQTNGPCSLDDPSFSEEDLLESFRVRGYKQALTTVFLLKMQLHYLYEDFDEAFFILEKQNHLWPNLVGLTWIEFRFYAFLVLIARAQKVKGTRRRSILRRLRSHLKTMTRLAKLCPVNFEHRRLLMEAELNGLLAKDRLAVDLYRKAAIVAAENKYLNHVSLIHENTANFYLRRGLETAAAAHFSEALLGYSAWGASEKCARLRKQHHFLLGLVNPLSQAQEAREEERRWTRTTDGSRAYDLGAILEATQTISSEIEVEALWMAMIQVIMKHSGAQRGCLIVRKQGSLVIEIEIDEQETRQPAIPLHGENARNLVPITVVTLVCRTQKSLMLEEPALEGEFIRDPYFQVRQPACMLCLPLSKQADLQGILVLEHFQSKTLFNRHSVAILEMLASTAAVSNENARFYARMEQTVAERTADLDARNRELESLDAMVETINSEIEAQAVCSALLAQGANLFSKPPRAVLFLASPERPFYPAASIGIPEMEPDELAVKTGDLPRDFLLGLMPWGNGLYLLEEEMAKPVFLGMEGRLKPTLVMELLLDEDHLGLILWEAGAPGKWGKVVREKLQRFGSHAASAVAKALFIEDLQEKKAEIQAKGEAIVKAQNQLVMSQRMATLGTLTAGVAHEINNPNNFISAGTQNLEIWCDRFSQFLAELAGEQAPAETMVAIENQIAQLKAQLADMRLGSCRINDIVEDLRLFTRHDEAVWKRIDIIASLRATLGLVGAMFPRVVMEVEQKEAIEILCRPADLNQVFLNLAQNGCLATEKNSQHGRGPGLLSISYRQELDEAMIFFEDNGLGIKTADHDKIFEAFYSNWEDSQATGLGLYNARRIVEQMGGRIEVSKQRDEGACLILHLPIRSPYGEAEGLY